VEAVKQAHTVLAIITIDKELVGGGAPIFYARNLQEQAQVASTLGRILDAMAHDLKNGVLIVVKH
jgi:hypothetical protein